jgi:aspartyl-tRNA(Asn)/glutamyl-tRNA(Gln) amidotransferase subunit A
MKAPLRDTATATDIAAAVSRGEVAASEVIEAALARIAGLDPRINAFTVVAAERARAQARRVDAARAAGARLGPLAGAPFGVKAMIDVAGQTTTAGSALYRNAPVAACDAAVVRRLEAAGAICVGALNMDEFGMGGTTENALYGPTRNPHDPRRTAGGSSGGSAAAVAAGLVPIALGGDALGSIRLPASLCGVYGLRPTPGTVPDQGVLGSRGTLSTVGPMARSVADVRAMHEALCGPLDDAGQPATLSYAVAGGYFREHLAPEAQAAVERVSQALRITRVVELPHARRARAAAMLVNCSESATGKLPALRERLGDFDPATRERFLAHALVPAQWYLAAQRFRRWHARIVQGLLDEVDVVVAPATPCTAPALGTPTIVIDGRTVPTGPTLGWFTQPLAGTDCPALCVPIDHGGMLPIGVQLLAGPGREARLFRAAAELERLGVAVAPVAVMPPSP